MKTKKNHSTLEFLPQGGEMGDLIRAKNWSKTSIGNPEDWPQSLRTTISIILNSKFPMFLFWGPELICFYNDAYRPSLGKEGKHPYILGSKAEDYWKEIWQDIKPLIDSILSGNEANLTEDQLLPIYRNGKVEDVYWTYSYSAVHDESGKPMGVFVTCTETTKKIMAIKQLQESEDRFRTLSDQTPMMVFMANKDAEVTYWNKSWLDYTGQTFEQAIGRSWDKIVHPNDYQRLLETYSISIEKRSNYTIEVRMKGKDGKYRWFLFSGGPHYLENQQYEGNVGSGMDIHDHKEALYELKNSKNEFQFVIEAAKLATFNYNPITNKFLCNERLKDWFGLKTKDNVDLSTAIASVAKKDQKRVKKAIQRSLEFSSGGSYDIDYTIIDPNTLQERMVRAKGSTLFNKDKVAYRFTGILIDVSKESLANKKIKESEQRFKLLAKSLPIMVWTADVNGNLNYFNKVVYKYSGLQQGEIDNDGWLQIVHKNEREENIKKWKNSIDTGNDFLFEHRFKRNDGKYRWQLSRATPQRNEEGKITMWVGTSTDIQDQKLFAKRLEKQVKKRTLELEQNNTYLENMNKELQAFAYISSHDLQEPLRKIQTFASRIVSNEYDNLSDRGKDWFRRMQNAAQRMQVLIEDLLTYSRVNNTEIHLENRDLTAIINEVIEDLEEELKEKNVKIELAQLNKINIIPFQFRQLINNLLTNAIKFSSTDRKPLIKISSKIKYGRDFENEKLIANNEYCYICISDNGIGFEPQYGNKIFEIFQRLHNRGDYEGTGIGLAIVKKVVDNHKGFITAIGTPKKGATFNIYIPVNTENILGLKEAL
ncbi:PAS domain S-box protein [Aquimarina muelleri]|uniref:PAS domain S-box protein n=1 Tax=Aquimarina muelleri TaxID=279356 RepID=UPI003F687C04